MVRVNVSMLNADQLIVFNTVMKAIGDSAVYPKVFFVDGTGGTGKTFVYNTLLATVRSRREIALAIASSGIAALLLNGGRTVHSRMKVPLSTNANSACSITKQSVLARLIQRASLLVWDEAPMSHKHVDECMDQTLRDLCSCDLPFGGKDIVFGGYFRLILPVIRRGTRGDVVSACLNSSSLWRYVNVLNLTINMRLRKLSSQDSLEVSEFSNFLLRVGEGTELEDENHMIHIDDKFVVPGNDISDLVSSVYGDIVNNYLDQNSMSLRILMSPKNETVDA